MTDTYTEDKFFKFTLLFSRAVFVCCFLTTFNMSDAPPNNNRGKGRGHRTRQRFNQPPAQIPTNNAEQSGVQPLFSVETDFPPFLTTSGQAAAYASSVNIVYIMLYISDLVYYL